MADQNQMGSELSPIDPAALAWAEYWYPIAWRGLLGASAATIFAACLATGFLLLQWRTTTIREHQADWKIARLNNETERLRADNLTLQKLLQPRRLMLSAETELQLAGIRKFDGTPVEIHFVPDFEAQVLANDMAPVLSVFGWKATVVTPFFILPEKFIKDGVMVTYSAAGERYAGAARALADALTKAGLSGPLGAPVEAKEFPPPTDPPRNLTEFEAGRTPPPPGPLNPLRATLFVLIGMKPIPKPAAGDAINK